MPFNLFGFSFRRKEKEKKEELSVVPSFESTEGRFMAASLYRHTFFSGINDNSQENLIKKYREISMYPEIENAIDEIVNEVFYVGDNSLPVELNLDNLDYNDTIKDKINKEFKNVLKVFRFKNNAYEYFKQWYIDGAIYFNVVINKNSPTEGIQDLRYIDSLKIKKVVEIKKEKTVGGILPIPDEYEEYFLYDNKLKIPPDSIVYATSGLTKAIPASELDSLTNVLNLSYLHKAIKPYNQLNMLEDAAIIYRISRAPERRVFKIPVGNAPRHKQEQYLEELMRKFRNKIAYDPATGELKDVTRVLSILEDFWIPVPEGTSGADITTLPGGQNLGEINDINYFKKKLYNSLYIPYSRINDAENQSPTQQIRATEIIKEELKFAKFIQRLRNRFSQIFLQALKIQLVLKNIIDLDDWENIKDSIIVDYKRDNHFFEYNESEIITRRIELASSALQLEGYFSKKYIQKNFLKLTDEEIEQIEMENKSAVKSEKGEVETPMLSGGFGSPSPEPELGPSENLETEPLGMNEPESSTPESGLETPEEETPEENLGKTPPPKEKI